MPYICNKSFNKKQKKKKTLLKLESSNAFLSVNFTDTQKTLKMRYPNTRGENHQFEWNICGEEKPRLDCNTIKLQETENLTFFGDFSFLLLRGCTTRNSG